MRRPVTPFRPLATNVVLLLDFLTTTQARESTFCELYGKKITYQDIYELITWTEFDPAVLLVIFSTLQTIFPALKIWTDNTLMMIFDKEHDEDPSSNENTHEKDSKIKILILKTLLTIRDNEVIWLPLKDRKDHLAILVASQREGKIKLNILSRHPMDFQVMTHKIKKILKEEFGLDCLLQISKIFNKLGDKSQYDWNLLISALQPSFDISIFPCDMSYFMAGFLPYLFLLHEQTIMDDSWILLAFGEKKGQENGQSNKFIHTFSQNTRMDPEKDINRHRLLSLQYLKKRKKKLGKHNRLAKWRRKMREAEMAQ